MKRRIAVLTSGRQDWGILRSTCMLLSRHPVFDLALIVSGMHLEEAHGMTVGAIEAAGLTPAARIRTARHGGAKEAAEMMGLLPPVLSDLQPEALLLVGDRSETLAAALVATLARLPIVHLHGGEESEGAIDNAFRHALTKLAHLHCVSHQLHARRVAQLGEEQSSIHVVGAPGLDNLWRHELPDRAALEADLGLALASPLVVVTFHPTTLGGDPGHEARELVAGLEACRCTYVVTLPNNDAGSEATRAVMQDFARAPGRVAVEALGEARFFGLLRLADAVAGNSSSGIIEAPALAVPAVNVGDRQAGRLRSKNVIDVPATAAAVEGGLRRALAPAFREALRREPRPMADGKAGERIVAVLESWTPSRPPRKRFVDQ